MITLNFQVLRVLLATWIASLILSSFCYAQRPNTAPINGLTDKRPEWQAYTNASIYMPDGTYTKGTLLVHKGRITAVGAAIKVPKQARNYDMQGKTIYPAFIDLFSHYGLTDEHEDDKKKKNSSSFNMPVYDSQKKQALYWNNAVHAERQPAHLFAPNDKDAKTLREQGFGSVLTFSGDGIVRGHAALVSLADLPAQKTLLNGQAAGAYSFNKGHSKQEYPSSLMGSIALLRQLHLDTDWYAKQPENEREFNLSLQNMQNLRKGPIIFQANNLNNTLRAATLGQELGLNLLIKSGGDDYQRTDVLKKANVTLIVPVDFPKPYDLSNPYMADELSLTDLMHWKTAPENPYRLAAAGVPFVLTAGDLKDKKDFLKNLRKAVKAGLTEKEAIAALTNTPARLIKAENDLGSLQKGRYANFIVTDGPLFDEKTRILESWIQGQPEIFKQLPDTSITGSYTFDTPFADNMKAVIAKKGTGFSYKTFADKDTLKTKGSFKDDFLTLTIALPKNKGTMLLSGWHKNSQITGRGTMPDGQEFGFTFSEQDDTAEPDKKITAKDTDSTKADTTDLKPLPVLYPFEAFGFEKLPVAKKVLIKNATVWTCGPQGKLTGSDVLIDDGKIAAIGKNLSADGATVIDGKTLHLTRASLTSIRILPSTDG